MGPMGPMGAHFYVFGGLSVLVVGFGCRFWLSVYVFLNYFFRYVPLCFAYCEAYIINVPPPYIPINPKVGGLGGAL